MAKRFCKNGHDTEKVGRTPHGLCRECHRIANRKYKERLRLNIPRTREWDSWKHKP